MPHIDNLTLLITVGCGVGFFLMICMVRMIIGLKLRWLLIAFYGLVFLLAFFTDKNLFERRLRFRRRDHRPHDRALYSGLWRGSFQYIER